jgi:DNA-binding GntR family transcriptional regulator
MSRHVTVVSVVDAIAENLRSQLFSGELSGDARLTEAAVAATYDVARPTAKAAIQQLVTDGLLLRDAHKTARVPSMGIDEARDLFFSRTCIESEVVRELARRQAAVATAEAANRSVHSFGEDPGFGVIAPVTDFHVALVRSLDSERMQRIFAGLMGEMRVLMAQMHHRRRLYVDLIAEEHDAILAGIASGDPEAAARAMSAHLTNARDRMLLAMEPAFTSSESGGLGQPGQADGAPDPRVA